jgi:hypothetical protein
MPLPNPPSLRALQAFGLAALPMRGRVRLVELLNATPGESSDVYCFAGRLSVFALLDLPRGASRKRCEDANRDDDFCPESFCSQRSQNTAEAGDN